MPQLRRHPVTELRGIGDRKAEALRELEVETVLDLVTLYPRRYLDRTSQATIAELGIGQEATLLVTVRRCHDFVPALHQCVPRDHQSNLVVVND